MSLRQFLATALLATAPLVSAQDKAAQGPPEKPTIGVVTRHGCMSSKGDLVQVELEIENGGTFNSKGKCNTACTKVQKYVAATSADQCFCGNEYPPQSAMVADNKCNEPCPGFGDEACT